MTKKLISLLIVTLFLVSVMALTATAKSRVTDLRSEKLSHYGFLFDKKANVVGTNEFASPGKEIPQQSLGISGDGNTPGIVIGHSWYDYQCNSSTTRQIDWRNPNPQIHMAFTQIFAVGGKRYVTYNVYDPVSGTWPLGADIGCPVSPPSGDAEGRAGFTSMDIRPDGGAVIGCHHSADNNGTNYSTAVYIDQTASSGIYCGFGQGSHAPNSLAEFAAQEPNPAEYSWPKIEYHINGNDTVIYALSVEAPDNTSLEQTMVLFRNAGSSLQSTWEAFVIDTVFFSLHNLTASRLTRKVAICYLDRAPENLQGNNDVYYLVSQDMGATWNLSNKVNVTNYQVDEVGYRAWLELSCLYDSNDYLHLIWNANLYNGDGQAAGGRNCRLFHWAENTDIISTIQNAEWDPSRNCGVAGSNVLNVAKFTISECNGRLYVIWNQWGDPDNGDSTDCADPNLSSAATNANAEIYLSVSSDLDGTLWDAPRNLTNTKTPNCDSTSGNECGNETWPFMSRYGMNNSQWSGLDWLSADDAYEVDPSADPPYTGNYYLDVLYVNDVIPGPAANTGGNNTTPDYYVPLLWFRLPCVEPVVEPRLLLSPINIFYPNYTQHGEATSYNIRVENAGNADLEVSKVFVQKTTYTDSNWLAVDQTTMSVPSGAPNNIDTLVVTLNNDGVINAPGTVVNLVGRVGFEWTRQIGLDTTFLPIDYYVADTVVGVVWDTVSTNLINLIVSNNGNMGNSNVGHLNMDFFGTSLECDDSSNYNSTNTDTIPGDATVYLGNASPVILTGSVVGTDTTVTASWAIFQDGFATPNGFKPVTGETPGGIKLTSKAHYVDTDLGYEAVHTGSFVTIDSHLVVEKTYYAPTANVAYLLQMMRIFPYDGQAHSGLIIGEAYDWDIPSDTGSKNSSGTDPVNDLIYMLGGEWNEPQGDNLECTNNDTRAGGAVRAGYYTQAEFNANPVIAHTDPIWGGYSELNPDYVYPSNGFIPNELYGNMLNNPGLNAQPSSVVDDQHIVLTHFNNYSLGAGDTLIIWTVMATVPPSLAKDAKDDLIAEILAGKAWLTANLGELKKSFTGCCIGMTGNADCSASEDPDISDITRLISFLYLQGVPLCCIAEADVDNSGGSSPTVNDVDISDITYLIAHLYLDHRALKPCP